MGKPSEIVFECIFCSSNNSFFVCLGQHEIHSTVTVKTTRSGGETFLSNKSRVTGVQDVITRMRNTEGNFLNWRYNSS